MRGLAAVVFVFFALCAPAFADELDDTIARLEKQLAAEPRNARVQLRLANAYGRKATSGGMMAAMSLAPKMRDGFLRAVELDPDLLDARFGLIEYYMQAPGFAGGSKDKALEQAAEIRKRDTFEGHRAFARIHTLKEDHDLALNEMTQAVREQPKSAKANYFLGNAYLNKKDWAAALQSYDTALSLDATYMPTYLRIGQHAARSESNYARGEEALRKYLAYTPSENEPAHGGAWFWLGLIQEKQGRKAEAKQSYLNAQKLVPQMKDLPEALKRVS